MDGILPFSFCRLRLRSWHESHVDGRRVCEVHDQKHLTSSGSGTTLSLLQHRPTEVMYSIGLAAEWDRKNHQELRGNPHIYAPNQGRSDGGYMGIYTLPPQKKSVQVNFYGVKMTSQRLLNSFIPPKNFYTPKTNFWLRPCSELLFCFSWNTPWLVWLYDCLFTPQKRDFRLQFFGYLVSKRLLVGSYSIRFWGVDRSFQNVTTCIMQLLI